MRWRSCARVVKGEVAAVEKDAKEALASAEEKYQTAVADLTSGIEEATASEREQVRQRDRRREAVGADREGAPRPTSRCCRSSPRPSTAS